MQLTGQKLAQHLAAPRKGEREFATSSHESLQACLKAGDVLLVAGSSRISTAIKYLTQSSWSHAALCIGNLLDSETAGEDARMLIEADINDGIRALDFDVSPYFQIVKPTIEGGG